MLSPKAFFCVGVFYEEDFDGAFVAVCDVN